MSDMYTEGDTRIAWTGNDNWRPFIHDERGKQIDDHEARIKRLEHAQYHDCDDACMAIWINEMSVTVREANKQWWADTSTGEPLNRNVGEMLMLVTSELSEAMEADRKALMDDKLPHRKGIEVELADALIRILDIGAGLNLDLGGAFVEKMNYNRTREDHKLENRLKPGGKKY